MRGRYSGAAKARGDRSALSTAGRPRDFCTGGRRIHARGDRSRIGGKAGCSSIWDQGRMTIIMRRVESAVPKDKSAL